MRGLRIDAAKKEVPDARNPVRKIAANPRMHHVAAQMPAGHPFLLDAQIPDQ
jgi:hypothetical protein